MLLQIADKFASETSDQIEEAVKAKYNNRAVFILKSSILIMCKYIYYHCVLGLCLVLTDTRALDSWTAS